MHNAPNNGCSYVCARQAEAATLQADLQAVHIAISSVASADATSSSGGGGGAVAEEIYYPLAVQSP